ncbi:MAG: DUF362 domain-containing protein [Cyanobacteria bacterium]|jgi:uncharacterized protein (DUF362 family)|nr:DUF362 domain-containing protein [Cyanobacteria bacterium GSL.Bin1]
MSYFNYKRRQMLRLLGLATGAAILPSACGLGKSGNSQAPSASSVQLKGNPSPDQVSRVALLKTDNRASAVPKILDLLQPDGFTDKTVFIKPNYNTGDPAPAATDTDLLDSLITEIEKTQPGKMTIGDRAGMADTRQAMERKGVFELAEKRGLETIVFDEMSAEQWQYFDQEGTHWQQGFAIARPILDADAVINTCCLKTHRFGGHFTLSLKNSIGLVAKYVPGDSFNYMGDLHSSPHQRKMIAEVNAAYDPSLVLLDGVEAFVNGGPANGKKVPANVMIAGRDRVAVDVVGLAILRSLGTTEQVSQGSIWDLEQIQRATELGLGVNNAEQIEILTADTSSQNLADQIRPLMS